MNWEQFREEVLSVIQPWRKNNKEKVKEYLSNHEWLKADILKLKRYVKDNKIVTLAITDKFIYGIDDMEMIYSVGRETLGITDNFK